MTSILPARARGSLARYAHRIRLRPPMMAIFLVAVAARCGTDDITRPNFTDPASAAVLPGETLATARWNGVTETLIAKTKPSQNAAWRIFAYVTLSQHTAVEEAAAAPGVTRAGIRGAVAGASVPVLRFLFPTEGATIDSALQAEEGTISQAQRAEFDAARTAGEAIAGRAVARASSDGFTTPWTGTVPTGPGKWSSLAKPPVPPLLPLGGQVHPIVMTSGSQFRPGPPPAYGSAAYQEGLAEVRRIADTRTAVQDSLAKFWAVPSGSLIAGLWNRIALGMVTTDKLGERATAHALALMNASGWDALIACHDAKYVYWLVRPSGADTAIHTSVGVPNHPSYPSNHSCLSGASAEALGSIFPAQRERLQQMANEASLSRLYGGIHYRFDMDAGLAISRKLGVLVRDIDAKGGLRRVLQ